MEIKTFGDALILAVVLVVYFAPIAHEIARRIKEGNDGQTD